MTSRELRQPTTFNSRSFRHSLSLQTQAITRNSPDTGEIIQTWTTAATIRGSISAIGGREFYQAKLVNSSLNLEVVVWYRPTITTAMRLLFGSRTFLIHAVHHDEVQRLETRLFCEEVNP